MSDPTPGASPIIRVEGLRAGYGANVLLTDVSFEVMPGEVFAILGTSGCGKSTLMKNMIGLYAPLAGRVLIDGEDIARVDEDAHRSLLRKFGVTYQMGALFGSMTVLANVRLPLEVHTELPDDAIDLVARMKLKMVGLDQSAHLMPAEMSGGMQKRAAIARAMALDPKILFLDEPSAGLDPITASSLDQLILTLAGSLGITFVVVTHELASIFTIADRVIMLDKRSKGIIATGHPAHLRDSSDNPWVRRFFNREPSPAESFT